MELQKNISGRIQEEVRPVIGLLSDPLILKLRRFFYKLFRFEFWPWWAMFIPMLPVYLYSVIRSGKLLYFTAVNPAISLGGFFGEDKTDIMDKVPNQYKAKHILVKSDLFDPRLLESEGLSFPVIVKPNVGERGYMVYVLHTVEDLKAYADFGFDFIIQEYLDLPIEAGILYSKAPSESKGKISSITLKEFMFVTGNGLLSLKQLIAIHPRHFVYANQLQLKYGQALEQVPVLGEVVEIHRIGNHCQGTRFLDGMHLNSEELLNSVEDMLSGYKGFDYGRLDLKVGSLEDLRKGKGLKVFEINGISAEPTHMYDQSNVFIAWRILASHWYRILQISLENIKKGVNPTPFNKFISQVYNHFMT